MSAENRINMTVEGKVKMLLSALLLGFSLVVSIRTRNPFIFLAMLLSSMGDFYIAASRGAIYQDRKKSKDMFYTGVAAFAFTHIIYAYVMAFDLRIRFFVTLAGLVTVFGTLAIILGVISNKNATIVYAICLIATCIIAYKFSIVAGIGYTLFIVSDLILALFEEKNPKWQYAIWASYVPAQAVILTSFLIK